MQHPVRAAAAVAAVLVMGAGGVAAVGPSEPAGATGGAQATAELRAADGRSLGSVSFFERGGSTRVEARGVAMPPGFHGFHVHEKGACDAPAFASAGPHYAGRGAAEHDDHAGDLPVLLVKRSGIADSGAWTDRFRVADVRGRAIIVHANADNYANVGPRYGGPDAETLKAGDSGDRIACGVIR